MRVTQRKGDIAVAQAIAYFTELGFDVALPLSESLPYDILVDTPDGIFRVQVKYSTNGQVSLRRIHSNSKGYVVKKPNGGYDWLFAYSPKYGFQLWKENFLGRSYVQMSRVA